MHVCSGVISDTTQGEDQIQMESHIFNQFGRWKFIVILASRSEKMKVFLSLCFYRHIQLFFFCFKINTLKTENSLKNKEK
jgi:hypothetical protein